MPSEIAARYVLLLLGEMKECHALKLPYRATSHAPPEIRAALKMPEPVAAIAAAPPKPVVALPAARPSLFDPAE
jgi:hypothetical protein